MLLVGTATGVPTAAVAALMATMVAVAKAGVTATVVTAAKAVATAIAVAAEGALLVGQQRECCAICPATRRRTAARAGVC